MARRTPATKPTRAPKVIASDADVAEGIGVLIAACPHLAEAHRFAGLPPLRRWQDGFAGLARIIVGQQLSTSSAAAIHGRLVSAVDPLTPRGLLRASDDTLRACGLSTAKIATLRAAAEAVERGQLDLGGLGAAEALAVREALTAVKGIGPWTADIYLLFCRGDADAFAPGDLALQVGLQMLLAQENKPSAAEIETFAERWKPWRGVAARLIWHYYGQMKGAGISQPAGKPAAALTSGGKRKTRAAAPTTPRPKSPRRLPARGGRSGG